jgi:hypothetical protein
MTEEEYYFDIKEELGRFLSDYPEAGTKLLVRQISSDGFVTNFRASTFEIRVPAGADRAMFLANVKYNLAKNIDDAHDLRSSIAASLHNCEVDIVTLHEKEPFLEHYARRDVPYVRAFIFFHELGHLMIDKARPAEVSKITPDLCLQRENIADAFATICMLRRFSCGKKIMEMVSWKRAFDGTEAATPTHMTTRVIDKILEDSRHFDFSTLTPAQFLLAAENYAAGSTPDIKEAQRLIDNRKYDAATYILPNRPEHIRSSMVTRLAVETLGCETPFQFYIGARLIKPFMCANDVCFSSSGKTLPPPEQAGINLDRLRDVFAARAKHFGFHTMAEQFLSAPAQKQTPARLPSCR